MSLFSVLFGKSNVVVFFSILFGKSHVDCSKYFSPNHTSLPSPFPSSSAMHRSPGHGIRRHPRFRPLRLLLLRGLHGRGEERKVKSKDNYYCILFGKTKVVFFPSPFSLGKTELASLFFFIFSLLHLCDPLFFAAPPLSSSSAFPFELFFERPFSSLRELGMRYDIVCTRSLPSANKDTPHSPLFPKPSVDILCSFFFCNDCGRNVSIRSKNLPAPSGFRFPRGGAKRGRERNLISEFGAKAERGRRRDHL